MLKSSCRELTCANSATQEPESLVRNVLPSLAGRLRQTGRSGRTCTYVVSNVFALQALSLAARRHSDIGASHHLYYTTAS